MVIDNWTNHSETENEGTAELLAGKTVSIKVEYYQDAGSASARLGWTQPGKPREIIPAKRLAPAVGKGAGLHAEYFRDRALTTPAFTRLDQKIDFDWSVVSPFARPKGSREGKPKLSVTLPAGTWLTEWLDPSSGTTKKRETFSHKGGIRNLLIPPMTTDLALRLTKN
jgi:hypothetical protein